MHILDNQTILITGGTGSWGNELVKQILDKSNPKEIRIYSRGEHKQVEMKAKFGNNPKLKFIVGDVRDKNILDYAAHGVDYIFHLAALKHVPVCEENPWEAVLTNIHGTQNVIEAAIKNEVKHVIDISTDKAVDPFNHYGVTKAAGEKMIINANVNYPTNTKFTCIRGGNVMGTNGSALPLFKKQINEKGEVTLTDPTMTRYLMSTVEAIGLIFQALDLAEGGEIFVMRMPAATVDLMADVMIKQSGKDVKKVVIGSRPGEKKDEVLVSKNEAPRTKIINDMYYVILPQFHDEKLEKKYADFKPIETEEFNSRNARQLTLDEFYQNIIDEPWNK